MVNESQKKQKKKKNPLLCQVWVVVVSTQLPTQKKQGALGSCWPCIVSKVWREKKNQQDATIRCLLSTSVSTCFGHHYAHLQENKDRVTAYGVLLWFCWMWLVAVVGRCVVGCEHCEGFCSTESNINQPHPAEPEQCTICSITVFVLLKMDIMMPETWWYRSW